MISYNMNPAQSITATGRVASIAVDIKKYGLPIFNIRAKIYSYVPANFETGWPLPIVNYVGQSTNVIAAADLTGVFATQTFTFANLSVSGQWTVVFSYESVTTHDQNNYVNFSVGFPDIYAGGTFIYYLEQSDQWIIYDPADLVFLCTYCNEGDLLTTTTTTGICIEYILLCTTEGEEAQFLVTHCQGEEETITVTYGQPQFLCLQYPPTPLDQYGIYDFGRPCEPTTTTTTAQCTLWMLENNDQTLVVWIYTECNGEETYVLQESGGPAIYVCSELEPVPSGNGTATNTQEACSSTPTTTTTTEMPN